MADLNSIAAWCELKEATLGWPKEDLPSVEFHVNLWHFSESSRRSFFEIGIKPTNPAGLEHIKLFLPFSISRSEISD